MEPKIRVKITHSAIVGDGTSVMDVGDRRESSANIWLDVIKNFHSHAVTTTELLQLTIPTMPDAHTHSLISCARLKL